MSTQRNRRAEGGRIDRERPFRFTFDGNTFTGYSGDTLASALLANDIHLVGRSFKYHRPRGIVGLGSEEPNAIIQLGVGDRGEPNIRATQIELYDGLVAESQNRWPSLDADVGAINSALSRFFPAGFYYKTFMWPASWWEKYEHFIRHAAGLGKAVSERDPDRYEKRHAHCDVLVVGGGPAGLAAALAAGRSGARVILADEQASFGGALQSENDVRVGGETSQAWIEAAVAELAAMPEVTLLPRTTVADYHDHNYLLAFERVTDHLGPDAPAHLPRQRSWRIRAKQVVLATGAIERPLVFADNDRPGVMLSSAVRGYVTRYGVVPGDKIVVFTNNDDAYRTAISAKDAGAAFVTIVDVRAEAAAGLVAAARDRGIVVYPAHGIVATRGGRRVKEVSLAPLTEGGVGTGRIDVDCDLIAMSGGWTPTVHLHSQSRGKLTWRDDIAAFVPGLVVQAEASAGMANGTFALSDGLAEGDKVGREAAAAAGFNGVEVAVPAAEEPAQTTIQPLWVVPGLKPLGRGAKHFVDFQNDVTAADVQLAAREGYISVEHLKRYTTTGMGTDQGKTSNIAALAILADVLGAPIPGVGTTTFRPPYTPSTIGAYGGRDVGALFDPTRLTPTDPWARSNGAKFEHVSQWMRAWYFPKDGEKMADAVNRECLAARNAVGIMDASTLGKIDIQGADAAEFLNRIYTNAWLKLGVGRCRYGLMLKEDGMVMDDGVTTRIAENHFHMTTTTGGAARVLDWLEEWSQTEWPELDVRFASVTEQWAVVSICGPKSRELLAELCDDIDLSDDAFPFMSMREGTVAGLNARVFRISFTGEHAYEINVPARYGLALWETLMETGEPYGITPYGTEAMHVLRAEVGFIIVGQETDGTVAATDLEMDWIISKKKPDFVGKRSLVREDLVKPDRKRLVGLLTEKPEEVIPEGAQIVAELKPAPPMTMIGHVTSSYYSANCERSIAMALVKGGPDRMGETVTIPLEGHPIRATIVEPKFYDPSGSKKDG